MPQEIGWIVIHAIGAGTLQFLAPVSAREKTDSESSGSAGCEEIPNTVANDDGRGNRDIQPRRRGQKEVGIRLGPGDLIPRNERHIRSQAKYRQIWAGRFQATAGRYRPRDL